MINYILIVAMTLIVGCTFSRTMHANIQGNNIFVPPYATVGNGNVEYNAVTSWSTCHANK